jgi:hypothetical protein
MADVIGLPVSGTGLALVTFRRSAIKALYRGTETTNLPVAVTEGLSSAREPLPNTAPLYQQMASMRLSNAGPGSPCICLSARPLSSAR